MRNQKSDAQTAKEKSARIFKWTKRIFAFLAVSLPLLARDALVNFISSSPNVLYFVFLCVFLACGIGTHNLVQRIKRGESWFGHSHDTSLSTAERPYVSIASIYLIRTSDPPTVAITLDNTGRTPAFELDSRVLWVSLTAKDEMKFSAPIPASADAPIMAFVPHRGGVVLSPKIDKARIDQVMSGKEFLYIYIQASYKGSDGQKHAYRYCGLYDPASDAFKLTPFHNSAD